MAQAIRRMRYHVSRMRKIGPTVLALVDHRKVRFPAVFLERQSGISSFKKPLDIELECIEVLPMTVIVQV